MTTNKKKNEKMKKAYIEQMLMWMVLFIGFIWMFFFVINYAKAIRLKDSMDDMGKYAARYVSKVTDQTTISNDSNLVTSLNNISIPMIADINLGDINCIIATTAPDNDNSQSIFIVQGTYNKSFLSGQGTNNVRSHTVVYNNNADAQITCTLNVTIN